MKPAAADMRRVATRRGTVVLLEPAPDGGWIIQEGKAVRLERLDTPKPGIARYREVAA